jgi:hypothetical protein
VLLPDQRATLVRGTKDMEPAMVDAPQQSIAFVDIGKNSFHVVGHDERGVIVLRQKWSRGQLEARPCRHAWCASSKIWPVIGPDINRPQLDLGSCRPSLELDFERNAERPMWGNARWCVDRPQVVTQGVFAPNVYGASW